MNVGWSVEQVSHCLRRGLHVLQIRRRGSRGGILRRDPGLELGYQCELMGFKRM